MTKITFITGNQNKADYLAKYLGFPVDHVKLDIAVTPSGENGYGWDKIFIPQGYTVTRASLEEKDDQKTYLQIKPFEKLKEFLESRVKK